MSALSNAPADSTAAEALAEKINAALEMIPDKEWSYSRLRVVVRDLSALSAPYVLTCDWMDPRSKTRQKQQEILQRELEWGARHSDDLGFLELASLRINRALQRSKSDAWGGLLPVLRVTKRDDLRAMGSAVGLWYEVEEVGGEEFEAR